jgi:high potential iron-sulfur protein
MAAKVSRRLALYQGLAFGAAASSALFSAACKKELSCTDTSGLSPMDVQMRTSLGYVDKSPQPEKLCSNCLHYKPAAENQCGGCAILKGPVHPKGYCNSWAAKPS